MVRPSGAPTAQPIPARRWCRADCDLSAEAELALEVRNRPIILLGRGDGRPFLCRRRTLGPRSGLRRIGDRCQRESLTVFADRAIEGKLQIPEVVCERQGNQVGSIAVLQDNGLAVAGHLEQPGVDGGDDRLVDDLRFVVHVGRRIS